MEAVLFIGLPGTGKSSFYKERFFQTHVRVSLDLLKTRYREQQILDVCVKTDQRFDVDNTNPTKAERARFIEALEAARATYVVKGYYFESKVEECLRRNALRSAGERVPDVAILSAARKLELPTLEEGFDALNYVRLTAAGFIVEEWKNEIR